MSSTTITVDAADTEARARLDALAERVSQLARRTQMSMKPERKDQTGRHLFGTRCKLCGGVIGPDIAGSAMCYGCYGSDHSLNVPKYVRELLHDRTEALWLIRKERDELRARIDAALCELYSFSRCELVGDARGVVRTILEGGNG